MGEAGHYREGAGEGKVGEQEGGGREEGGVGREGRVVCWYELQVKGLTEHEHGLGDRGIPLVSFFHPPLVSSYLFPFSYSVSAQSGRVHTLNS